MPASSNLRVCSGIAVALLAGILPACAQTAAGESSPPVAAYTMKIPVDEVRLTFHAQDVEGHAVRDLRQDEVNLLDNGKPPRKILAFETLPNLPIHAGFLIDTSPSMAEDLGLNRSIAMRYVDKVLRKDTDQAFVMDFAFASEVEQIWTSDARTLAAAVSQPATYGGIHMRGTALYDAIYRACLNQFGHIDAAHSGNFILLFSDGEDNASRASFQQAVDMCQRNHTSIYTFRPRPNLSFGSSGARILADFARETGGHAFSDGESDAEIENDLRGIESDLRNQYLMVYRPAEIKHDGGFHHVEVKAPARVSTLSVRSGYYAPIH